MIKNEHAILLGKIDLISNAYTLINGVTLKLTIPLSSFSPVRWNSPVKIQRMP